MNGATLNVVDTESTPEIREVRISSLVETGHLALSFTKLDFFLQILALVGMSFSFSYANLNFDSAVFPIHSQERKGAAFDRCLCGEFEDFPLVEQ
jgi:hypothetical protein